MRMKDFRHWLALAALCLSGTALAQGTITDGAFSVDYNPASSGSNTDVSGLSSGDAVYQISWFYRVAGDTSESILINPNMEDYSGNQATLTYNNQGSPGSRFNATVTLEVEDAGPDQVRINTSAVVTAIDDVAVTIFFYIDVDLGGTASGDSATLLADPSSVQVTDEGTGAVFNILASGNREFQVTEYSDLQDALLDDAITDLDGTGLPFGPEDFTLAYEWSEISLAPGERGIFGVGTAANTDAESQTFGTRPAPAIPTLDQLGLLLMVLLLGGIGMRAIRQT